MQVKKQQLELDMEQWTGSKIGKGVRQACMLSPCLFNLYAEYIVKNGGEAQVGIKISRRTINTLRYADDTTFMANAPHSSTLAWKIPWTEEPARLQSMRPLRVGHD